ncbi:MAG TPA: (2Fe-2S)-binding protein [Gaiellaceae bacterium]|jgi:carbon-monoxide dehydrogenase small subunit
MTEHASRWLAPDERAEVALVLNGENAVLEAEPRRTLADAVRATGLTGTHLGCEHGVCGACTVLLDDEPVRSCLVLAVQAAGRRVDTVERLAAGGTLHPVQEAFLRHRALQCGFCTPGFVVLAEWLARREPDASEERVGEVVSSSLCRCTGYAPILAAVRDALGRR